MNDTPIFSHAAVAAPHVLAAQAGREILSEGGNAIEAMIAMAATIAIAYPHMNGIGGDGFWLIRDPSGRARAIEACGYAGAGATIKSYRDLGLDSIPPRGPLAALTVPGTIGGWEQALEISGDVGGRLPLRVLLEQATRLAREGAPVSPSETRFPVKDDAALLAAPNFARTYLIDDKPAEAGALRKMPALANTLDQLARAGLDDFYRGDIGREMAADLEKIGSAVTRADLASYRAVQRTPLSVRIEGASLMNTPPPTQGLASLLLLALHDRRKIKFNDGFAHYHGLIEATKRAFALRDRICTDYPGCREDAAAALAEASLQREAAMIDGQRAASKVLAAAGGDTIWMGAIDARGMAVSFIQSVYWEFGSGCVLPRTGVLMQNRGVSFSLDAAAPNALKPGRKPFHTLNAPIAALDDGRVMTYGSMGGDGQPQFQAQTFSAYRAHGDLARALEAPRLLYGRSWGAMSAAVRVEDGFDDAIAAALMRAGHEVDRGGTKNHDAFGHAGALIRRVDGSIEAAHDPRSDGGAEGI
jgi:gamma-glutamyltranspeptidase